MSEIRVTVRNTADAGGTFTTPFYFGFHNGSFDLFDVGAAATPGLEALAEDGNFMPIASERLAVDPNSQGAVIAPGGPFAPGAVASQNITLEASQTFVSFGAMILPSNDAFVGTDQALQLFDASGNFLGAQTVVFDGTDVYDAGTEVNTELDAAFLNQSGPNTGVDENGVITLHPGFNGSAGNPVGEGDQNILGGTTAPGAVIDPVAGDFTLPGAQIAEVHINTVAFQTGTAGSDLLIGGSDDDIIDAGAGSDLIRGESGFDVIDAGNGDDLVFAGLGDDIVIGGEGNDLLIGGAGRDSIEGDSGNDRILGGAEADELLGSGGSDFISGGSGEDLINGGSSDDVLDGGVGDDIVEGGTGDDVISGATGNDTLAGGGGDDIIDGDAGNDEIAGGSGNDIIDGGGNADTIFAGVGDDLVDGGDGNDTINGGAGADSLSGGLGSDVLTGGAGNDTFFFADGDERAVITDFSAGDQIVLSVAGVEDFSDVVDAASNGATGTRLEFGSDLIILEGVSVASLVVDDFIFS